MKVCQLSGGSFRLTLNLRGQLRITVGAEIPGWRDATSVGDLAEAS
jgi:hypothetical protein